jgi:hypothetical protein
MFILVQLKKAIRLLADLVQLQLPVGRGVFGVYLSAQTVF